MLDSKDGNTSWWMLIIEIFLRQDTIKVIGCPLRVWNRSSSLYLFVRLRGKQADFLQHNLHILTHPVYNNKTITLDSLFLHRVKKNRTIVQACFYTVSIPINLYIFSLFSNVTWRQNIQTNHQRNMQRTKQKFSDDDWSRVDFSFSFTRDVVSIHHGCTDRSSVDSTQFWDKQSPPLCRTKDTHFSWLL